MKNEKVLGILGGGQLARMMILEAHRLGIKTYVLSSSANDPAAKVSSHWIEGNPNSLEHLKTFLKLVTHITFESEFLSLESLRFLRKKRSLNIFPKVELMETFQDRKFQKKSLVENKLKTSKYFSFDTFEELEEKLSKLKLPVVIKARKQGYDGKGTFILKNLKDKQLRTFLSVFNSGFIAEEFIPFKRELAITVCRNTSGDVIFLPLVESYQHENRCLWVKGPISHPKVKIFKNKVKKFVNKLDYVGCLTFELFDTGEELLINELAPRVHNSAHYSQDALNFSQFSLHLLAGLNLPLSKVTPISSGFAMYNLIGSSNKKPKLIHETSLFLHWYDKEKNYPGRKMGHVNALADTPEKALKKLTKDIKGFSL